MRCEHVILKPPNYLIFDFLEKDPIRYYNSVVIDEKVSKNIVFQAGEGLGRFI